MADISLEWGGDFETSASGGLVMADGDDLARQRLARRLYTPVNGYVWHQDYGAGLPQKVGSLYQPRQIEAIVRSQVALEDAVAPSPPATVTVTAIAPDATDIDVEYTSAKTGTAISFTLTG
jgi:hypothetical protein